LEIKVSHDQGCHIVASFLTLTFMVNIGLRFCWLNGQIHESEDEVEDEDEDAKGRVVMRLPRLHCTKMRQMKILSKVTYETVTLILVKGIVLYILVCIVSVGVFQCAH
jgi:hypothetical protein